MKGNKQIFSKNKTDRIKGYKKLFREQKEYYAPRKDIAKDLVEAMEAQGFDITIKEAIAYLQSSYAVFDRRYYIAHVAR